MIATRGSRLAIAQASLAQEALKRNGYETELVTVRTKGDIRKDEPLRMIGGDGLFVREIERTLLAGEADIAVHCGKDLPYELAEGLLIGGVLPSGDVRDCLVARRNITVKTVATGSERRREAYRRLCPGIAFTDIRGNIDTRLEKLRSGEYDALLLAKAGLDRLGADLTEFDVKVFSPEEIIPAAGQGILALECRASDTKTLSLLKAVSDALTEERLRIEREVLRALDADCTEAVGVYAEHEEERIRISAMLRGQRASVLFPHTEIHRSGEVMRNALKG